MSQLWPSFWLQAYRSLQVLLMAPSLSLMLLSAALSAHSQVLTGETTLARADAVVLLPGSSFSFRIWTGPSGAIQAKHDRELGPRDLVLACSGFGGFLDLPDERAQVVRIRLDRPATRPFAGRFLRPCNVDNRSHIVVASERHPGRPSRLQLPNLPTSGLVGVG